MHPEKVRRVVLVNEKETSKWIDILNYDGDKLIQIYSASTLELAQEFEQWEKNHDAKAIYK